MTTEAFDDNVHNILGGNPQLSGTAPTAQELGEFFSALGYPQKTRAADFKLVQEFRHIAQGVHTAAAEQFEQIVGEYLQRNVTYNVLWEALERTHPKAFEI